jgi:hypothetical protein
VTLEDQVALFGTEAIIEYRDKPAIRSNEPSIPEACISLSIASQLIKTSKLDARVEVAYPKILKSLGASGPAITPKFGGQRADITTYEQGVPSALIEIKIIDESRKPEGIVNDWRKVALLQNHLRETGLPIIPGYLGALVCDTPNRTTDQAIDSLCEALALDPSLIMRGTVTTASLSGWEWVFICVKLV